MPDYKEMYKNLFQTITQCIDLLQNAQIKTEEMYISSAPPIKLSDSIKEKNDKSDTI